MANYLEIARRALPRIPPEPVALTRIDGTPDAEAGLNPAEVAHSVGALNRAGVRLMRVGGVVTIGVWSDLDGLEVRAALRTFGLDRVAIRYLDGADIPMRYKLRGVDGEPCPMTVLTEMERHPAEPWTVRDRMLKEIRSCSQGVAWPERKAAALNRLFQEQGRTGELGRIVAATVRHGEGTGGKSAEEFRCS